MSKTKLFSTLLGLAVAVLLTTSAQAAYSWTTIGDPDNSGDTFEDNYGDTVTRGAVDYVYDISVHNTTGNQWDEFVGGYGGPGLEDYESDDDNFGDGTAVGSFVNYRATVNGGTDLPVQNVSFHQAAQYANWLTTDDATKGVYTIDSDGYVTDVDRNAYSEYYAIPTADEWYKAAYYDVGDKSYQSWATKDGSEPSEGVDGWNYGTYFDDNGLQEVGFSPEELNGTHDMMGQTYEWLEDTDGWYNGGTGLPYMENTGHNKHWPADKEFDASFRLVQVPEPSSLVLLGLAGLLLMKRRRA